MWGILRLGGTEPWLGCELLSGKQPLFGNGGIFDIEMPTILLASRVYSCVRLLTLAWLSGNFIFLSVRGRTSIQRLFFLVIAGDLTMLN